MIKTLYLPIYVLTKKNYEYEKEIYRSTNRNDKRMFIVYAIFSYEKEKSWNKFPLSITKDINIGVLWLMSNEIIWAKYV